MKQLAAAALLFLVTLPLSAQNTMPRDEKIDLVASDLHALGRVVTVAENVERERQVLLAIADSDL